MYKAGKQTQSILNWYVNLRSWKTESFAWTTLSVSPLFLQHATYNKKGVVNRLLSYRGRRPILICYIFRFFPWITQLRISNRHTIQQSKIPIANKLSLMINLASWKFSIRLDKVTMPYMDRFWWCDLTRISANRGIHRTAWSVDQRWWRISTCLLDNRTIDFWTHRAVQRADLSGQGCGQCTFNARR